MPPRQSRGISQRISGGTTTLKEIPPIEFTATFYLLKDVAQGIDDFADWPAFQNVIESTIKDSTPIAVDIYHPDLASQYPPINSVCKASVGGALDDGKGGRTIVVKFQEYRPPKPKGGSPSGSKAKPDPNDPDAAALAEIAKLTVQYKNTPWQ